jgi:hypothetical protein
MRLCMCKQGEPEPRLTRIAHELARSVSEMFAVRIGLGFRLKTNAPVSPSPKQQQQQQQTPLAFLLKGNGAQNTASPLLQSRTHLR